MKSEIYCLTLSVLLLGCNTTAKDPIEARHAVSRTFSIPSWGNSAPELEIYLPSDWDYKQNKGPDFDVHEFTARDGSGSIGIYIGTAPGLQHSDATARSKHFVGQKNVEFSSKQIGQGEVFTEAIVSGFFQGYKGDGVSDLLLHVMVHERRPGFSQTAWEALKTLTPKKRG